MENTVMLRLSENAEKKLDHYLRQLRACLRGCRTVDADEIEQNIMDHIQNELSGAVEPIALDDLEPVLTKLGSPRQWIPEDEISWWRKMMLRLRTGPEDSRLAYLSFALLVLGLLSGPGVIILIPASFYISRTALSIAGGTEQINQQKRLIYPTLVVVYLFLACVILFGPVLLLLGFADVLEGPMVGPGPFQDDADYWIVAWIVIAAVTGIWWLIATLALYGRPNSLKAAFYPFLEKVSRKWILTLAGFATAWIATSILIAALFAHFREDTFLKLMVSLSGQ